MGSARRSKMWGGLGVLVAVLSIAGTGWGKVIYVDADGPADFNNIQAAIEDSDVVHGDTIVVYPGTYTENISFNGKNIILKSTEPTNPHIVANTIIDGNRLGSTVTFLGSEASSCLLSGFTITGGESSSAGGGIQGSGTHATISYCNITDNIGRSGGIRSASGVITDCVITNNYASDVGGGLGFCHDSTVTNCVISHNSAENYGGGTSYSNYITISNCLISHNSAGVGGGLASPFHSKITSCTIVNNTSTVREAGGVCFGDHSSIMNSIVWGNSPSQLGSYIESFYCDIQGRVSGTGNIEADPIFLDPDNEDYHLRFDSPCIDLGHNPWPNLLPLKDLEGNVRQIDGNNDGRVNVDIGAYEYGTVETPLISARPEEFEFTVVANDPNPHSQVISIWNIGLDALSWQIVEDCPWLDVSPNMGYSTGEIDEVTLTVDVTDLTPGRYPYDLAVSDETASNDPVVVPIVLIVYDQGRLRVPSEFLTIQDAVDVAGNGDIITVEDGIYKGFGNRNIDCLDKQLTIRSPNGPAFTIIDCENADYGFCIDSGDRLEGFTVLNAFEGGIRAWGSFTIDRCVISDGSESGIVCSGVGDQFIANCLILGNGSYGIQWMSTGQPDIAEITNCTIAKNLGGGIYSVGAGRSGPFSLKSSVANSILWGNLGRQIIEYVENDVTVTYSNIEGGWPGEGNIDLPPLFADPNKNDYHLKSQSGRWDEVTQSWIQDDVTSPCIDAGDPASPIGSEPFPNGGIVNIGAYGGTEEASKSYFGSPLCEIIVAGDINGDCDINFLDFAIIARSWAFTYPLPSPAINPNPPTGSTRVVTSPILSWEAGEGAVSHDVYFGTTSPGTFQDNQTETTFSPGSLPESTTYYWHINEINASGTTTGDVWSFTTTDGAVIR